MSDFVSHDSQSHFLIYRIYTSHIFWYTEYVYENPGQRWLPVMIFFFNREYLLNYRRYGKIVNMFFVATSMYFPKMQKFLHFTSILRAFFAFDWIWPFWQNLIFGRFLGFTQIYALRMKAFVFLNRFRCG